MMRTIQTTASFDDEFYSLTICFTNEHCVTLDGLSLEDMNELKSCIDCILMEDENGIG